MKNNMWNLAESIHDLMIEIDAHLKKNKNLSKQDLETILDEYGINMIKINGLFVYHYELAEVEDDMEFIYKGMRHVDSYEIYDANSPAIYTDYIFLFDTDTDIDI